mmetsp:Transcript_8675/g.13053  ORF Transcript_8675/g.13053 Transcript_8675/m.13053 type:complete len:247 (-) Transcript_8675:1191-1931(-)
MRLQARLQATLFTLLQMQAALSDGDAPRQTNATDCAAQCNTKRIQRSAQKMKKCLEMNCGTFAFALDTDTNNYRVDYGDGEESGADTDLPGKPNTCVSRCKRLRFSPARQTSCITDCEQYDDGLGKRLNVDVEENKVDRFPGNHNACVSHCKRLGWSPARQDNCISACDLGNNSGKKSSNNLDLEGDKNTDVSGNHNAACVSRCKKLRFGPARRESCIAACDQGDSLEKKPNIDSSAAGDSIKPTP